MWTGQGWNKGDLKLFSSTQSSRWWTERNRDKAKRPCPKPSCLTSTLCHCMPSPASTHTHTHTHTTTHSHKHVALHKVPANSKNRPHSHKLGIDWHNTKNMLGPSLVLGGLTVRSGCCQMWRGGDGTDRLWCLPYWMYLMDGSKLHIVSQKDGAYKRWTIEGWEGTYTHRYHDAG